jgi:Fanconi anemia group M protein
MPEELHICVDSNEASSRRDLLNYLRLSGVTIDIKKLTVCDYVVSDRVGVERKDAGDFLGSIMDGRLFSQAKAMAEAYEKPIIILEGTMSRALKRSAMKPASVYGALSSVALDYGISVLPTEDINSTAMLLQRLAYREQAKDNRAIQLRAVDRSLPLNKQQLFLLSGFPQIGTASAEDLLESFDTPLRVIEELASAEIKISASGKTKRLKGPLTEVGGIGPTIVEYAQTLLKSSYRVACSENPD